MTHAKNIALRTHTLYLTVPALYLLRISVGPVILLTVDTRHIMTYYFMDILINSANSIFHLRQKHVSIIAIFDE